MFPGSHLFYPHVWIRCKLKWRKFMCLVLCLGSALAISQLLLFIYPVPTNSCDWSPGLSSGMTTFLGTRVTSVGAYDILFFVSACLVWTDLLSPWGAQEPVSFCKVCRKCGYRNASHSCYNKAVQGSPQGPICWRYTWVQGGYFHLLDITSFWASIQVDFLPHPTICVNNWGNREWGRKLRKIPILSIRSVYGSARWQS